MLPSVRSQFKSALTSPALCAWRDPMTRPNMGAEQCRDCSFEVSEVANWLANMAEQAQALLFVMRACRGRRFAQSSRRSSRVFRHEVERVGARRALQREQVRDAFRLLFLQKLLQVAVRDGRQLRANAVGERHVVGEFLSPAEEFVAFGTSSLEREIVEQHVGREA